MAYQPATGFRSKPASLSQPVGRTNLAHQPSEPRSQQESNLEVSLRPSKSSNQAVLPALPAREERMRRRAN